MAFGGKECAAALVVVWYVVCTGVHCAFAPDQARQRADKREGPVLDSIRIQTIEILYNFKLIIIKIELNYKERIKTMIPYHPY